MQWVIGIGSPNITEANVYIIDNVSLPIISLKNKNGEIKMLQILDEFNFYFKRCFYVISHIYRREIGDYIVFELSNQSESDLSAERYIAVFVDKDTRDSFYELLGKEVVQIDETQTTDLRF